MKKTSVTKFVGNWLMILLAPIWVWAFFVYALLTEKSYGDVRRGREWLISIL
jgi:hypothetical protein